MEGHGHTVVEAGRRRRQGAALFVPVRAIDGDTDWRPALAGVDAVVHLAGLAHCPEAGQAEYFTVNDAGTRRLVEACEEFGIGAFVHLGSIAAREGIDAYGASKRAGEDHVRRFAEAQGRVGIILRPPLVYGHDAPGNWERLQRLAATDLPLPLGRVKNRRSLCSVGNLCDAISAALDGALRNAASGTYEIADREQASLGAIVTWLRAGMGKPPRLLPVPPSILRKAARAGGRARLAEALLDDLTVDPADFMRAFGWNPPEAMRNAIETSGRLYALRRKEVRKASSEEP